MNDKPTLPGGARLAADQDSAPISHAAAGPGGIPMVNAPELVGVQATVQHPYKPGDKPDLRPGLIGCGVMLVDGEARFLLQMKHADGTSLMATMDAETYLGFGELFVQLPRQAAMAGMNVMGRG